MAVSPAGLHTKMYPSKQKIANIRTLGIVWKDFMCQSSWLCIKFIFLRDTGVAISESELSVLN